MQGDGSDQNLDGAGGNERVQCHSNLDVLYYNSRSILPKLDELRLICADRRPHVVSIVETWLDTSVLDSELIISNYSIVRLDRNRHGGGVLLYIRDDVPYNVTFVGPDNLELLGLTLYNENNSRFCLCVLYSPPATTHLVLQQLFIFLQKLNPSLFSNFVIIGDFNVNFLDSSSCLYHSLLTILSSFNLTQVVQKPTRMAPSGTATLIDLALMSAPDSLRKCDVIPPLSNSDHNGVELTISWRRTIQRSRPRPIWKYSLADFDRACHELQNVDWDALLVGHNIDAAWQLWESTFMTIIENCIPKGVLPKKRNLPWVNAGIRRAIRKRNLFHRKSKRNPVHKAKYKHLRNLVVSQIRNAKKMYVENIPTNNSKQFWRAIKLMNGIGSSSIPVLNQDGRTIVCDKQKADVLNHFFHSCFNNALPPLTAEDCPCGLDPAACPQELYCSEQEVFELLVNLDVTKASGPDGISARMLKGTAASIAPVLCKIFNYSIETGRLPSVWKSSNIVPVPKGSNGDKPSNYRPISLLPIISKVLERIIYSRVVDHLVSNCPLAANQWGFMPGKSTTSALLSATYDWFTMLEDGNEVGAVFFDLTKAFDSVPHRKLLGKLQELGLNAYIVNWISDYLTNRTQSVVLNGVSSTTLPVLSGVPQGSILGPLLFLMYLNDINDTTISSGSKLVLYADDILLYRAVHSQEDYFALQQDVDTLAAWSSTKLLKFNPSKCKAMLLSRKRSKMSIPCTLLLNQMPLEFVDSFKYLGLNITSDLTWSRHIETITSKARRLVGLLFRQFYHCADTNTLKKLYVSLIRPHLEYACQVWDPSSAKECNLLEKVQRFASRVCLKTWNMDYSEMLNSLDLPSLQTRRKVQKLSLLYKIINAEAEFPEAPLTSRTVSCWYPTRSVDNLSFCNLYGHTYKFMSSYFPSTIKLWNSLPYSIRSCTSLISFHNSLNAYFVYGCN